VDEEVGERGGGGGGKGGERGGRGVEGEVALMTSQLSLEKGVHHMSVALQNRDGREVFRLVGVVLVVVD
jgi:hypothetical protein